MWYVVDTIYAGALDGSETFTGEDAETAAYAYAKAEAEDCAAEAAKPRPEPDGVDIEDTWEVYVLPHYCDFESDEECVCRQYDTDHHPTFNSEAFDREASC